MSGGTTTWHNFKTVRDKTVMEEPLPAGYDAGLLLRRSLRWLAPHGALLGKAYTTTGAIGP